MPLCRYGAALGSRTAATSQKPLASSALISPQAYIAAVSRPLACCGRRARYPISTVFIPAMPKVPTRVSAETAAEP